MSSSLPQPHPQYGMYNVERELRHTAYIGDLKFAQQLVTAYPELNVNAVDEYGRTSLYMACERQQSAMIDWLLEQKNIDVNYPTMLGNSPLLMATWNDDNTTAEKLIKHGANTHARTNTNREYHGGVSASDIARERGNDALLKALANQTVAGQKTTFFVKSDVKLNDGSTPDTVTTKPTKPSGR